MLADLFPPARLALAMSVFLIGATVGNGLSIGLGGAIVSLAEAGHVYELPLIGKVMSWQYVFIVTGLPGLVLGGLIFFVREPKRRDRLGLVHPPIKETLRFLAARRRFFTAHFAGFCLLAIIGWGFSGWLPTYMSRQFGWTIGQLTLPLALILGIGGTFGTLASGWLVDRLFGGARTTPTCECTYISRSGCRWWRDSLQVSDPWIFLAFVTPIVATMSTAATAGAALQIVAPNEMRGQVAALFLFVVNGVGLGLGPTIVGATTDFVFHDEARLSTSLALLFGVLGPAAALTLSLGLKPMREAVQLAEAWRTVDG